jgi:hypothetical protein
MDPHAGDVLKKENAYMSQQDSSYRQQTADEVVESRDVVRGSVPNDGPQGAPPGYSESTVSRGASPLAMWINVISIVLAIVDGLIAIRFVLKLLGANAGAGFATLIYGVTGPLVAPFNGLLGNPSSGTGNQFELTSLIAMAIYALAAWLLTRIVALVLNRTVTRTRQNFS